MSVAARSVVVMNTTRGLEAPGAVVLTLGRAPFGGKAEWAGGTVTVCPQGRRLAADECRALAALADGGLIAWPLGAAAHAAAA